VPATTDLPLPPRQLARISAGIARSPLWYDLADPTPEARSAVRVLATPRYEAWVLGWWPGHGVELHDHGDSHAAFTVVVGELVEITARPSGAIERRALRRGDTRVVPAGTRHDVLDLADRPATSIHVYSPALTSMTFFDPIDQTPTRVEPVLGSDAVWPDEAAHRWLHPSRAHRG
jgi:mannose-6-phosphate isomerase-like protein (cupin superfamily)